MRHCGYSGSVAATGTAAGRPRGAGRAAALASRCRACPRPGRRSDRRDPSGGQQAGHARPPPAVAPRLARWRTPGRRGAAALSRRRTRLRRSCPAAGAGAARRSSRRHGPGTSVNSSSRSSPPAPACPGSCLPCRHRGLVPRVGGIRPGAGRAHGYPRDVRPCRRGVRRPRPADRRPPVAGRDPGRGLDGPRPGEPSGRRGSVGAAVAGRIHDRRGG